MGSTNLSDAPVVPAHVPPELARDVAVQIAALAPPSRAMKSSFSSKSG